MFFKKISLMSFLLICLPILSMEKSQNLEQETELIKAVHDNDIEKVQALIDNGANVNARNGEKPVIPHHFRETVLMIAVSMGHDAIAKLLIETGADIEARDNYTVGHSVLWMGIMCNKPKMVRLLIDNKVHVHERSDYMYGQTPIMTAANHGNVQIIKLFLNAKANTNECDHKGRNALDIFIAYNRHCPQFKKITKILNINMLKYKWLRFKDADGLTPLMLAVSDRNTTPSIQFIPNSSVIRKDIVEKLLRRGAGSSVLFENNNGETAIDIASKNGFYDIAKILKKYTTKRS